MSGLAQALSTFPPEVRFTKTWRSYQARVLDQLDDHLHDGRIHVVAAPGSGKTVLGLEIMRRLNAPTLILSPTLTIRNQWQQRFTELFLPAGSPPPEWISYDLSRPALVTITTYQALHSAYSGRADREEEEAEAVGLVEAADGQPEDPVNGEVGLAAGGEEPAQPIPNFSAILGNAAFGTLILDEAHHLRTAWWRTLQRVVVELEGATLVALTATPPYDVSPQEWERYEQLCGPVDAEVSIPELVKQGDLCPHQDYVFFSAPAPKAQYTIQQFRWEAEHLLRDLLHSTKLADLVEEHPWVSDPEAHIEAILQEPAYASSLVIYLHGVGRKVPQELLRILGTWDRAVQVLDFSWTEILLTFVLYADVERFPPHTPFLKDLRRRLQQMGAIERKRVTLTSPAAFGPLLTTSASKLHSIQEIVRLESAALGAGLRLLVLTDYIRRNLLPRSTEEKPEFDELGVVPIFESLRQSGVEGIRLGVLSGSLVVLPAESVERLRELTSAAGLLPTELTAAPLRHAPDYCVVQLRASGSQKLVRLVTDLFSEGGVTVLVGTKALLGEGWDAPAINTLVLASFVGSYMLSNQMRGRSIRTWQLQPKKTANIWHLVCVEPGIWGPGEDWLLFERRFKAFAALGYERQVIESGIDRFEFPSPPLSSEQLGEMNTLSMRRALDRESMQQNWQQALDPGKRLVEVVRAPDPALPREFAFDRTWRALLWQGGMVAFFTASVIVENLAPAVPGGALLQVLVFAAVVGFLVGLPYALKALRIAFRHRSLESSLQTVGTVIAETLYSMGQFETSWSELQVKANRSEHGSVLCWLEGARPNEVSQFLRALQEVLNPVENPRYLLARTGRGWLAREDYHAIPDIVGRKKENAERFHRQWLRCVGPAELVFTRSPAGRRLLLRARVRSTAARFQKRSERVSAWE